MRKNTCSKCKWIDWPDPNKPATCHRHPPIVMPWTANQQGAYDSRPIITTDGAFSEWPEVNGSDFCGEFEAA